MSSLCPRPSVRPSAVADGSGIARLWEERRSPIRNEHAAAEHNYHCALAVAQRQSAKFWELRAALDLARLWRDQGKREEARELLAPVYDWFTEGFDTRDLKEAKATGHCEDVIINANPPWIDRQTCEAVGKSMTETLGGTYECAPYRSPTDAM